MRISKTLIVAVLLSLLACKQQQAPPFHGDDPAILNENQRQLTKVIIYDVFTPPVASRIYAYTSLSCYEAMRFARPGYPSLAEKLNGFPEMPVPEPRQSYDFGLAASWAFFKVAHKVVFSVDSLKSYEA